MAFTFLTSGYSIQGASGSTTGNLDTTGANLLLLTITSLSSAAIPTVSDSKSNTWADSHSTSDGTITTRMYKCLTPTVGTLHTFTVSGTACAGSIAVWAFSVGGGVSSQDQANDNGTATPGPITPTQNNEVIVTMCGTAPGPIAATACSGGYTVDGSGQDLMSACCGISFGHLIQTTAATTNPTWSGGSGVSSAGLIVSFQIGGGSTNTPLSGAAAAVAVAGSTAVLAEGMSGVAAAVAVAGSTAVLAEGMSGAAAAVAVAGSTAVLAEGMSGAAAAVAVAGSTAVLAEGMSGAAAAVTVAGSTAVLAEGMSGAAAAVTVAGSTAVLATGPSLAAAAVHLVALPAALGTGVRAGPGVVATAGIAAALRTGSSAPPGAVHLVGSVALLDRSGPSPAGRVVVTGSPATLVALSPPGPPPPPPPPPAAGSGRAARPRRRTGTQVYDQLPPDLGSGPTLAPGG